VKEGEREREGERGEKSRKSTGQQRQQHSGQKEQRRWCSGYVLRWLLALGVLLARRAGAAVSGPAGWVRGNMLYYYHELLDKIDININNSNNIKK
jgi:hypothetical protein